MAMTLDQARQAIITKAMAFTGIDQTRIKYPNKDFTVPVDGLWCDINVLWGRSSIVGIGDNPCIRRTGLISINCMARLNTHEVAITKLSEAWLNYFECTIIGNLEILQGEVQNLGDDGNFVKYNVRIGYLVN